MAANRCKQKITGYPDFCPSYQDTLQVIEMSDSPEATPVRQMWQLTCGWGALAVRVCACSVVSQKGLPYTIAPMCKSVTNGLPEEGLSHS